MHLKHYCRARSSNSNACGFTHCSLWLYVHAAELPDVRTSTPISSLQRNSNGTVTLTTAAGKRETFDAVVLATHSDTSLQILGQGATQEERAVLAAIPYNNNDIYLHTDQQLMPVDKKAWASWNFLVRIYGSL
jgi:predicted NAD/FAD-binding protein